MNTIEHLVSIQTRLERIERLLKKEQEDDTYMSITEASNYTRYSVSTLRKSLELGDLTCTRQGGRNGKTIFKKSSLTEWLEK
jgi:excisionase family DNA binding protein